VADGTPLLYVPPLAVLAVVLVGPVALLVASLLAALPARRAARLRVGDVLRAE
jgi:ABC-type lipoprotein release transport system permease subunit